MTQAPPALSRLVIVGGGTAGWMTAAFLTRFFASDIEQGIRSVTVIESAEIGTVGVGEATIPPISLFNGAVGIDEATFMRKTQATYKLGIEFDGWTKTGERYLHAFGTIGVPINGISFHAYWLKARQMGQAADLAAYSLNTMAAYNGKFAKPDPNPNSLKSSIGYAFHFDAGLYAAHLRSLSEARGVRRIEATIKDVTLGEDGGIDSVMLADGRHIEGDYFFDCSGFRSLLLGGALKVPFESWSDYLPADRAIALPCERVAPPVPYTRAKAQSAGWTWRIPLQHRTGNGYVYASHHISDDEALCVLRNDIDGRETAEPRMIRFATGRRVVVRAKNCLALGLAAGFLEPLESTSIHFIQFALIKFSATFPTGRIDPVSDRFYNETLIDEMVHVRDFLIFHYHANARTGEPFWDYLRHMPIPGSLRDKIELFEARGLCLFPQQTVFQEPSWLTVMLGQGLRPQAYDPLADCVDTSKMIDGLERLRRMVAQDVANMPTHESVLQALAARP